MKRVLMLGLLAGLGLMARAEEYLYHPRDAEEAGGNPRFVVPDPDAHGGSAQAAIPGQSRAGSYTAALYAYCRPAGQYRVTWRLKLDDNTLPDVVMKVHTGDEQGRGGFKGGSLAIKGTDFKAANAYQDFTYLAEKAEGGFFNVGALWQGQGRVHLDFIRIVPEKLYTEREMLERQGKVDLPEAWVIRRPAPPVVHLGKGLWWNFFGLSDAMAELGGAVWTSSYHCSGQYGMTLRNYPQTWRDLMGYNLVVLTNVDAQAVGPYGRMLLEEYVKNGGALLLFGGPSAYGRGGFKGTALERLLPGEMAGADRIKVEGANVLQPAAGAAGILPADLPWNLKPCLYYLHPMTARAGAVVLATVGDRPAVMAWNCGKGRVAAFAMTAEGEAAGDQLAFWEWGGFPRLVGAVMHWLVAEQGKNPPPANSAETRKLLEEVLAPVAGEDPAKRERQIRALLARCFDKGFARDLLDAVATYEGTPGRDFGNAVARAVQPFVDAEFAKDAKLLIESGNAGKAAIGLQVLGMCRTPEAGPLIVKFLDKGSGALKSDTGGDEVKMDDLMNEARGAGLGDDQRLKLAAVIALGDLGDPAHLDRLKRVSLQFAAKATAAAVGSDTGEVTDLKENLLQQSLAARARLGDVAAVRPFFDEIMKNITQIERHINYLDVMLLDPDDKDLMRGRKVAVVQLPILRQRQALCLDVARQFPASVYPGVADDLANRSDERLAPFVYAALTRTDAKKAPAADTAAAFAAAVGKCRVPELRLLAFNVAAATGDTACMTRLAEVLAGLAGGKDKADAVFAVRNAARLSAAGRQAVLAAAAQHPDPLVQRLARAAAVP